MCTPYRILSLQWTIVFLCLSHPLALMVGPSVLLRLRGCLVLFSWSTGDLGAHTDRCGAQLSQESEQRWHQHLGCWMQQ